MSETISFPPLAETGALAKRAPTVYFIDDSATMREVIKIAFRKENITVITAGDAATAIAQFDQNPPDAVITDVIMPDQDGYAVCSQIKQHQRFARTPVILMSGVVNKNVADKAVSVGADELIRKPFQPVSCGVRATHFASFAAEWPVCASAARQSFAASTRRSACRPVPRGSLAHGARQRVPAAATGTSPELPAKRSRPGGLPTCAAGAGTYNGGGRGRAKTQNRDLATRTPDQETSDGAADRAPVQSSARAAHQIPHYARVVNRLAIAYRHLCILRNSPDSPRPRAVPKLSSEA